MVGTVECDTGCVDCELARFHEVFVTLGWTTEVCTEGSLTIEKTPLGTRKVPEDAFAFATQRVERVTAIDQEGEWAEVRFNLGYQLTDLGSDFVRAYPAPPGKPFLCASSRGVEDYVLAPVGSCVGVPVPLRAEFAYSSDRGWERDATDGGQWSPR
jgi:hypothetical protein